MSSRALRRLQKEQEHKKQLEDRTKQVEEESEEEEEEEKLAPKALNAFEMLNQGENEEDTDSEPPVAEDDLPDGQDQLHGTLMTSDKSMSKKSKKKKNKKKGKEKAQIGGISNAVHPSKNSSTLDEIDLALKSLSTETKNGSTAPSFPTIDEANLQLYRLLAVESKHLNALNEMKRLFGNVVTESQDEDVPAPRRRGRGPQQVDLGGALTARNSPVARGQGLRGLALRRNPFIMGKEEWPQATSGGLGMKLVEKLEDGTIKYRFDHATVYQDVQRQFQSCVESMDPQRMISMLQFNPYHISTLLQVSEIAKQQGDHSVSGDLLERALFSFGRSVHPSFTTALAEGKARLEFERPENREFWLAAWRYVMNLGQRGTWRTAYEWAKLILSLDPEWDPYCVGDVLDQLALRGGQSEHYLQLSRCSLFSEGLWKDRPNVQISAGLAEYRLKEPQKCRGTLTKAIVAFPWIFSRLFQELNIPHTPSSIWGSTPRSDREKFDCEFYVYNAKDLWSTPEAISLLVEVAETAPKGNPAPPSMMGMTLEEARHVLLSGVPSLMNLVPRRFTNLATTSSDPLPPDESLLTYDPIDHDGALIPQDESHDAREEPQNPDDELADQVPAELFPQGFQGIHSLISRLLPWLRNQTEEAEGRDHEEVTEAEVHAAVEAAVNAGFPREVVGAGGMEELRMATERVGTEEEEEEEGDTDDEAGEQQDLLRHSDAIPSTAWLREDIWTPNGMPSSSSTQNAAPEAYDEDRNKRWLAGQGLIQLREFTKEHGSDENSWPGVSSGKEIVSLYASRVTQLRERKTRNFIVDYVLRQGTSREVKELIEREIERMGG